jgi:hypothetical protein
MNTITGRDVDMIALQEFSSVMNDFHFDMLENTQELSVTYGEKGKKWIKRIKKIDPFWDENLFISNLFVKSMQNAINEASEKTNEENIKEEVKSE